MRSTVSSPREHDAERTRANIVSVATKEFAEKGLAGARIDEIASKTKTSKRMIYYYYGSKEGLYRHVLETAYGKVRIQEDDLRLGRLAPVDALRALTRFSYQHHLRNPDFIRLIMIENVHRAEFLQGSPAIASLNASAIERIDRIYLQGVADGVFRGGLKPLQIHWLISALSFFSVSNKPTFSTIFGWDWTETDGQSVLEDQVVETVLRFVLVAPKIEEICG
ncbi:MAG: TetR family transcriptional regulator [Rhodospirillaceae bacterium]|nr:TetR family transcriptional regulator [Rhodospirillaceae bacterium]